MKQFQEINNKIIEIINKQKINFREIKNENYKLPISDAMFCIEDTKRNLLFYQAIKSAIEKLKENTEQIQVWVVGCGS
jgi:prephenate dehydratase